MAWSGGDDVFPTRYLANSPADIRRLAAPIAFLDYVLEARGLEPADLEPFIGSPGKVAAVMNRQLPLSLEMIRRLAAGLNLPAEVLIQEYALHRDAA